MSKHKCKLWDVWMVLLDSPGRWHSLGDLTLSTETTRPQVVHYIHALDTPCLEQCMEDGRLYVRVEGTPDRLEDLRIELARVCYFVSDEDVSRVMEVMHDGEWHTIGDICDITGMKRAEVRYTLLAVKGMEETLPRRGVAKRFRVDTMRSVEV